MLAAKTNKSFSGFFIVSMKILSEENILERKSEFELFVHYSGITDLKLGRLYRSPLYYRLDRKPSFNIFRSSRGTNSLMYKDFGNGSDTGNVFAFIAKLYGINYYQALKKVNEAQAAPIPAITLVSPETAL